MLNIKFQFYFEPAITSLWRVNFKLCALSLLHWNDGPSTSPACMHNYFLMIVLVTGRQAQGDKGWNDGMME